MFFIKIIVT